MGNIQKMNVSANGLAIIKEFEGLIQYCYDDQDPHYPPLKYNAGYGGVITIGWGHTNSTPPHFGWGDTWSVKQCEDALNFDTNNEMKPLKAEIGTFEINQNQYDAICSFSFNLGGYIWFDPSNKLYTKLKNKDWNALAEEMKLFVYGGGAVMPGLVKRRQKEAELLLKPVKGGETSKPPATENKPKDPVKPNESEQKPNGNTNKDTSNTADRNFLKIDGGTFYLRNNELRHLGKLGTIMNRSQDVLRPVLKPVTTNSTDKNSGSGDKNQTGNKDTENNNSNYVIKNALVKLNEFMKIVNSVPLGSLVYQSKRPQLNPNVCHWADCSGFIGWCLSSFYPDAWQNGNCNTATLYSYFKSKKLVLGTGTNLATMQGVLGIRKGDIVFFGKDYNFGTGTASHIGVFLDDDRICSVGNGKSPHVYTVAQQVGGRPSGEVYAIVRAFRNKDEKPSEGGSNTTTAGQQKVKDWIAKNTGKWIDVDGMYGAQCMDLVVRYGLDFWNFQFTGNAENLRHQTLPAGFQRIQNSAGFVPQLGDIFIWYGSAHPYGHTGIIIDADLNGYNCLNQNTAGTQGGAGSEAVVSHYNYSAGPFWGVVRPPI